MLLGVKNQILKAHNNILSRSQQMISVVFSHTNNPMLQKIESSTWKEKKEKAQSYWGKGILKTL